MHAPLPSLPHSVLAAQTRHVPLVHKAVAQSLRPVQTFPGAQRRQEPPQSMSVSAPFLMPSTLHRSGVHLPRWQTLSGPHEVPSGFLPRHLPFFRV